MFMITFKEDEHKYEGNGIKWTSVTSFIGLFKESFDSIAAAEKATQNKKSKWFNMSVQDILNAWDLERDRSVTLGNWYHKQRESDIVGCDTIEREGVNLIINPPVIKDGIKISLNQKLEDGIYPEHIVYLESIGLCGQADLVEVVNGKINITDFKTNKEIKKTSFVKNGVSKKMKAPLSHLDDCNFNHYSLQLSLYAYMIKKHNPKLKIGKLTIQHVIFKQLGLDKYGYPVNDYVNGEPIVKDVIFNDVVYLNNEIENLIIWAKNNGYKTF